MNQCVFLFLDHKTIPHHCSDHPADVDRIRSVLMVHLWVPQSFFGVIQDFKTDVHHKVLKLLKGKCHRKNKREIFRQMLYDQQQTVQPYQSKAQAGQAKLLPICDLPIQQHPNLWCRRHWRNNIGDRGRQETEVHWLHLRFCEGLRPKCPSV